MERNDTSQLAFFLTLDHSHTTHSVIIRIKKDDLKKEEIQEREENLQKEKKKKQIRTSCSKNWKKGEGIGVHFSGMVQNVTFYIQSVRK